MSTAGDAVRNGLLLEGLGKPVDLNAVDWHVRHRNPSASPSEIQNATLELIRAVVSDGLFRLGPSARRMNDSSPGEGRSIIRSTRFLTSTSTTTTTPTDGCLRRGCRSPQRVSGSPNAWKRKTPTYIGARAAEAS
jgi:hypothetical protein